MTLMLMLRMKRGLQRSASLLRAAVCLDKCVFLQRGLDAALFVRQPAVFGNICTLCTTHTPRCTDVCGQPEHNHVPPNTFDPEQKQARRGTAGKNKCHLERKKNVALKSAKVNSVCARLERSALMLFSDRILHLSTPGMSKTAAKNRRFVGRLPFYQGAKIFSFSEVHLAGTGLDLADLGAAEQVHLIESV